jgi:hypothetical protein
MFGVSECLEGRPSLTIFASVRPFPVIEFQPLIQISLQFLQGGVQLFTKSNLIKLILDRSMETLADAITLGRPGFGFGMINVLNG